MPTLIFLGPNKGLSPKLKKRGPDKATASFFENSILVTKCELGIRLRDSNLGEKSQNAYKLASMVFLS